MLTRLKASSDAPRTVIVRVNLRYGIALLIPKTLLQNLLRNRRLLSSELKIMIMPSTAGKVQISILMIRIAKPIFKSGIVILRKIVHKRDSRKRQLKLELTGEIAIHAVLLRFTLVSLVVKVCGERKFTNI